jgi:hypothetical protein
MKQYNLKGNIREFPFGKLNVLTLGERGRGRYEAIVPFQSGLSETDFVIPVPTKSGKIKIIKGGDGKDWIARISCEGVYTRHTQGYAYVHPQDKAKVKILAQGNGAEGAAGGVGYWEDYLLQIEDKTLLKVKKHGGYKTPAYYLFFNENKVLEMNEEELFIWAENYDYDKLDEFEYIV